MTRARIGQHRALRCSRSAVASALVVLMVASGACGGPAARRPAAVRSAGPPSSAAASSPARPGVKRARRFGHVFLVVMENEPFAAALADPSIARLARRYAYEANSYAAAHPSLPNYLALTGGSTFGITSDCLTCFVSAPNLAQQLQAAHLSWDGYFQSVSQSCYLGTSYGEYAAKHNPFRYYRDVRSRRALCSHLRPYAELRSALEAPARRTPAFVWVTPNVCYDGHSCPLFLAGRFLTGLVREITASAAWRDGGLLLVTWDEGSGGDPRSITPAGRVLPSGGGGHILTLVITPRLPPGTVLGAPMSHYGLLATIEENFRLPLLAKARGWAAHSLFRFPS